MQSFGASVKLRKQLAMVSEPLRATVDRSVNTAISHCRRRSGGRSPRKPRAARHPHPPGSKKSQGVGTAEAGPA